MSDKILSFRETVGEADWRTGSLTFRAALAELFTEVLGGDAGTGGVTGLPGVVTWLVVVHVIGRAI